MGSKTGRPLPPTQQYGGGNRTGRAPSLVAGGAPRRTHWEIQGNPHDRLGSNLAPPRFTTGITVVCAESQPVRRLPVRRIRDRRVAGRPVSNGSIFHRLGQNSILSISSGKKTPLSVMVREKKQRLEVVSGVDCIYQ